MESIVYRIPVFGWALREAVHGPGTTKALFIVNMVLAWLLAILKFGYPAIILPALAFVPIMFVVLIALTWPGNKV